MTQITIYPDDKLLSVIRAEAKAQNRSMSNYVLSLTTEKLKSEGKYSDDITKEKLAKSEFVVQKETK